MKQQFNPDTIRLLDKEIERRFPNRHGWVLIDTSGTETNGLPARIVHVRSYLKDSSALPGFRLDPVTSIRLSEVLSWPAQYIRVFLYSSNLPLPTLYEWWQELEAKKMPWLLLQTRAEARQFLIFEKNGERTETHAGSLFWRAGILPHELIGQETRLVYFSFPYQVHIHAPQLPAKMVIKLNQPTGFSRDLYYFVLDSSQGRPEYTGYLKIDVQVNPYNLDEITCCPLEPEPSLIVQPYESVPEIPPERIFHNGKVTLHLVFDRTTVDPEALPLVCYGSHPVHETAPSVKDEDAFISVPASIQPETSQKSIEKSNQGLRQTLGQALQNCLPDFHPHVDLILWWFADTPRGGMTRPANVPTVDIPKGKFGSSSLSHIAKHLNQALFDYASGLDLFDAVDEVLLEIANELRSRIARGEQHLILIVGDSPPPPSGTDDVIWENLVERPLRTNARRSPDFRNALQMLQQMQVRVAWLFIRSTNFPVISKPDWEKTVRDFITLKENIINTLQQIPALIIADTDLDGFESILAKLLHTAVLKQAELRPIQIWGTSAFREQSFNQAEDGVFSIGQSPSPGYLQANGQGTLSELVALLDQFQQHPKIAAPKIFRLIDALEKGELIQVCTVLLKSRFNSTQVRQFLREMNRIVQLKASDLTEDPEVQKLNQQIAVAKEKRKQAHHQQAYVAQLQQELHTLHRQKNELTDHLHKLELRKRTLLHCHTECEALAARLAKILERR